MTSGMTTSRADAGLLGGPPLRFSRSRSRARRTEASERIRSAALGVTGHGLDGQAAFAAHRRALGAADGLAGARRLRRRSSSSGRRSMTAPPGRGRLARRRAGLRAWPGGAAGPAPGGRGPRGPPGPGRAPGAGTRGQGRIADGAAASGRGRGRPAAAVDRRGAAAGRGRRAAGADRRAARRALAEVGVLEAAGRPFGPIGGGGRAGRRGARATADRCGSGRPGWASTDSADAARRAARPDAGGAAANRSRGGACDRRAAASGLGFGRRGRRAPERASARRPGPARRAAGAAWTGAAGGAAAAAAAGATARRGGLGAGRFLAGAAAVGFGLRLLGAGGLDHPLAGGAFLGRQAVVRLGGGTLALLRRGAGAAARTRGVRRRTARQDCRSASRGCRARLVSTTTVFVRPWLKLCFTVPALTDPPVRGFRVRGLRPLLFSSLIRSLYSPTGRIPALIP